MSAPFIGTRVFAVAKLFRRHWVSIPVILLFFAIAWVIVYLDGGTKYVHLHIVYIPILIAAFRYKEWGGLASGLIGMIVVGPLMPLDVDAGLMQPASNWIFRGVYLSAIGLLVGFLNRIILKGRDLRFRLANYDLSTDLPLSGPLRRHIEDILDADRPGARQHAVVNFRVSNGNRIHSSFGVAAYELAMRGVADRLRGLIPAGAFLAREGRNRFICFLSDAPEDRALEQAREIHRAFQAPIEIDGLPILVEAEVGLACFPDHGDDPEELLRASYAAISWTPSGPSDLVRRFDRNQDEVQRSNLRLLSELRQAIDERQLQFYAQPKVSADGSLWGAELLVRWPHPDFGFIPPDRFIPLAEQSQLIFDITRSALEAAETYMTRTRAAAPDAPLRFSVNISGDDIADPRFPDHLRAVFGASDACLGLLELEITETSILHDPDHLVPALDRLREMGVHIAIDDFGTGYSSLVHLREIPADTLKIDQSFVRHVIVSEQDAVLVRRTMQIGQDLGMQIVAEGVETPEIADWLIGNGCDRLQGYWYSRPLPIEEWCAYAAAAPTAPDGP